MGVSNDSSVQCSSFCCFVAFGSRSLVDMIVLTKSGSLRFLGDCGDAGGFLKSILACVMRALLTSFDIFIMFQRSSLSVRLPCSLRSLGSSLENTITCGGFMHSW